MFIASAPGYFRGKPLFSNFSTFKNRNENSRIHLTIYHYIHAFLKFINLLAFKLSATSILSHKRICESFQIPFNHFLSNLRFLPKLRQISIRSFTELPLSFNPIVTESPMDFNSQV